ncbi:MAG: nucleotide exchange factor GrpE [Clostridia bacterium]|nr:nucleotide exchange factor GrpE [Clostridia bacterium]
MEEKIEKEETLKTDDVPSAETTEKEDKSDKKSSKGKNKEVKELTDKVKELEAKLEEYDDRYKRMAAEYDNYRKRTAKEREGAYNEAFCDAIKEILPVIDNLERALSFADAQSTADDKLAEGVVMTMKQLADTFTKLGIETIGEKGEKFDPELHNAVMHGEDETMGENEISDVFQRGYRKGDRIIRHAMVKQVN